MTKVAPRRPTLWIAAAVGCTALPTLAAEQFPYSQVPTGFPGLTTGWLQPENTNSGELGARQTAAADGGGTGTQVYDWSFVFRGEAPFQTGLSFQIYDDVPNVDILGSGDKISFASASLDGKYAIYVDARLAVAIEASVAYLTYTSGAQVADDFLGATVSLPASYRLTPTAFANAEVGYTVLPDRVAGQDGFGNRGFMAAGLAWQPGDRVSVYGSAKALLRQIDTGIEGTEDRIYTIGARAALTPQIAATAFATNAYSDASVLDDVTFFAAPDDVTYGLALTYVPSNRLTRIARYGAPDVAAADTTLTFGDGVTMMGPATVGANQMRATLSYGSAGNPALALLMSPDPDIQAEFIFENYALTDDNPFRAPAREDTRYSAGVRYQALAEGDGDPVSLGARLAFGRDIKQPTAGVVFAEAALRRTVADGLELTVAPRAAASSDDRFYALGLGAGWALSGDTQVFGEYGVVGGDADDNVWAIGLRRTFFDESAALDLFVTNASGRSGIGTMLSGKSQIGLSATWQPGFTLF